MENTAEGKKSLKASPKFLLSFSEDLRMSNESKELYEFGDFRLEVAERRLWKSGQLLATPPKVFDLLSVLVRNANSLVEKDELLATLWPGAFVEESNLSVNISALRRLLGDAAGDSAFIETVPKRGYRFIAPLKTPLPPAAKPESVAVLPFLPIGSSGAAESLGLGIADAVTTRLAAAKSIEVRSTSLVAPFSQPSRDPLAIARTLKVDAILDGRVQTVKDRLRVTAQLLRTQDGHQLWAKTFDDTFSNIFHVQDEIADHAMRALAMPFDTAPASRRVTSNPLAYQHYLQGQFLTAKRLHAATESAIASFEAAIAEDSFYPLPYAALAHSYLIRAGEGWEGNLREKAKSAALRAVNLDDQLAESQLALGEVLMRADWDWAGAERAFRKAITLDDRLAPAHAALSTLWTSLGRHDQALEEIRTACRLDPNMPTWQADLAWTLLFAGKTDEAILEGQRAVALDAWSYSARRQLAKAYLFAGRLPEAAVEARKALEINGSRRMRVLTELAKIYAAANDRAHLESSLTELDRMSKDQIREPFPHYETAVLHLARHRRDDALRELSLALDKRISRVLWMRQDPELQPLHGDQRFNQLVERLRLPR